MKYLFLCCLTFSLWASVEQYPEDRQYSQTDQGYKQYGAPSLFNSGKYVLTFDDGPDLIKTPKLLDVLKEHQVKATFFVITERIGEREYLIIKRMLDEGHIVASHGKSHDNSNQIPKAIWKTKVKQSFLDLAKIYRRAGHTFNKIYYRFPYAAYGLRHDHHHFNTLKEISQELTGDNCIQFAFWDFDSGDWIPKMSSNDVFSNLVTTNEGGPFITYKKVNGALIKRNTDMASSSGGVILQHDIQANAVAATSSFLNYVKEKNLEVIPLNDVQEFKVKLNCPGL